MDAGYDAQKRDRCLLTVVINKCHTFIFSYIVSETNSVDKLQQRPHRGSECAQESSAVHQTVVPVDTRVTRDTDGQREVGTVARSARVGGDPQETGEARPKEGELERAQREQSRRGDRRGVLPAGLRRGGNTTGDFRPLDAGLRVVRCVHSVGEHCVGVH